MSSIIYMQKIYNKLKTKCKKKHNKYNKHKKQLVHFRTIVQINNKTQKKKKKKKNKINFQMIGNQMIVNKTRIWTIL